MAALAAISLGGCFGSGGSSAAPPNNVAVAAKDGRVVVTWDMQPGVQYWIWKAAGTGVTPKTCSSLPQCTTSINVTSPATISGLSNGVTYSFTINSRINNGPGGDGSPAKSATPRLAGDTWRAGNVMGTNMRGVAYGTLNGVGTFVAVGDSGLSYSGTLNSSIDGITWAPLNSATSSGLNAVNYDSAHAKYLAVGTGGAIVALTPATSNTNWSLLASPTTNTLYALTNNGTGFTVATGAGGTVITSGDGSTWTVQSSVSALTTQPLYGVAYGYDSTNARNVFVAVGAGGTILYSADGAAWSSALSGQAFDLKSVTYGAAAGVFLAVGTNGAVLTSPNGINWTKVSTTVLTPSGLNLGTLASSLNAVTFSAGRRFVAVGNDGNIFYSEYTSAGSTWTQITPPVTLNAIYAIATGGLYDYSAVGTAGLNLYSD